MTFKLFLFRRIFKKCKIELFKYLHDKIITKRGNNYFFLIKFLKSK